MKFTAGTSWFPGCPAPRKNIQAICKYASSRLALISNTDHYITSGQICCPGMLITKIGLLWSRCGSLKEKRHLQSFMHCLPIVLMGFSPLAFSSSEEQQQHMLHPVYAWQMYAELRVYGEVINFSFSRVRYYKPTALTLDYEGIWFILSRSGSVFSSGPAS